MAIREARRALREMWPACGASYVPFPVPVSLTRADIPELHADAYVWAPKTDGVRACLVVGPDPADPGWRVAVSVDRASRWTRVARWPGESRTRTMLDCERVGDRYVVLDAFYVDGTPVHDLPFASRRRRAGAYLGALEGPLRATLKEWYPMSAVRLYAAMDHATDDGLVFMPDRDPVARNRHRRMFKLKFEHTVDLGWNGRDYVCLRYGDAGRTTPVVHPRVAVRRPEDPARIGRVYECRLVAAGMAVVDRARPDKTRPNAEHTVDRTLDNFEEAITVDDVAL